jgi:cytochrome c
MKMPWSWPPVIAQRPTIEKAVSSRQRWRRAAKLYATIVPLVLGGFWGKVLPSANAPESRRGHDMKTLLPILAASLALAAPAFAEGDAAKGEKEFRKCKACHMIVADDGTEIVKGGKTGPNLYGVIGRAAGSTDFKYSDVMKEAGQTGLVWDETELVAYLADPTKYLEERSGDAAGKSKMTFKLAKGGEDVAAYLASVVK